MKGCSFFLCATLLATSVVYGQTSASNMMMGGSLELYSTSYQGNAHNNSNTVRFSPDFGYFIRNNFALGLGASFYKYRSGTDQARLVNQSFSLGPFARYYFFTSNEKLAFFGNAQLGFGSDKSVQASGDITRGNSISFTLSPGAAYFFNEHWAAEFSFGWLSVRSSDPNTDRDNDRYRSTSFTISSFSPALGVRYHL